jgi:hypothetical protein
LKRPLRVGVVLLLGALSLPTLGHARDFGVYIPSIHAGKLTSSVLYEYLKVNEDFDNRGRVDFKSHAAGAQFTYGINDKLALSLKGGLLIDPEEAAQGSRWTGHSGYLYGIDLYHEVFPATGVWPGIQGSVGATGFQVPLTHLESGGTTTLIDQRMTGVDYHGSVLMVAKWQRFTPYAGVRLFGRSVTWRDNQSEANGGPGHISGHAHGNASIVLGLPFRISDVLQFQAEAILVSETVLTAGLTIAAF